jgi:hypothetical protein
MSIDFPKDPTPSEIYEYTYNGATQKWIWGWDGATGVSAWIAQGFSTTSVPGTVYGRIESAAKVSGKAQWNYTIKQATYDGTSWNVGASPLTTSGINLLEANNTTTEAYGLGVLTPDGVTLDDFTGFSVKQVPTDKIVEVTTDGTYFFFSAPNPIDGTC